MIAISKKLLLLNIILSQALLLALAFILWAVLRVLNITISLSSLVQLNAIGKTTAVLCIGIAVLFILQAIFLRTIPWEKLFDEINQMLLERFSLIELVPIFFLGALSEEFLFRGIIQTVVGVWLTAIIFTLIHYRYWRKIYILIEVFLMGIILGFVFYFSGNLWAPILCHFAINILTALMFKRGYIREAKKA